MKGKWCPGLRGPSLRPPPAPIAYLLDTTRLARPIGLGASSGVNEVVASARICFAIVMRLLLEQEGTWPSLPSELSLDLSSSEGPERPLRERNNPEDTCRASCP